MGFNSIKEMNRIDRLQAILIHLQSKKIVTAAELAERFDISLRTVYRDIRALEEAGVPIGAEAGIGYFIAENYHLPPVMFSPEEASSLVFGAKLIEQMSDQNTQKSFESALFKIKSVLRQKEKEELDVLQQHISVFDYSQASKHENKDVLHLSQKAIVNKKRLKLEYKAKNGSVSQRKIEPIGLTFYGGNWHLIGYCTLRNDYRDFRVDRIIKLEVLDNELVSGQHKTLDEYFETIQSPDDLYDITLLANKETLHFIEESKYWYGYTHEEEYDDNYKKIHFKNADLYGFSRWVILGGKNAIVLEPTVLRNIIVEFAKEISEHYLI